jgi:hypothetical protein
MLGTGYALSSTEHRNMLDTTQIAYLLCVTNYQEYRYEDAVDRRPA